MISAFGVEHPDDISKAGFPTLKMPKAPGSGASFGAKAVDGAKGLKAKVTPMAQRIGANTKGIGQVGISTVKNNKTASGIAAGAGAAGLGGGYMAGKKKRP